MAEQVDVVDLLTAQHSLIRDLFEEVKTAQGEAREEAFHRLRRMLAVHETAEEEVVHPIARHVLDGGDDGLVDDRLAEENEAKKMLGELEGMQPGKPDFMELLDRLRMAVLAHARSEERYEFMKLRDKTDPSTLRAMAASVKVAEAFAPTHPHAGVESATANLVAGPITALVDRVRDAVRGTSGTTDDPRS
ncbi:MAG: hemerythrin domain-containing protein [Pseudonocardiales bacterium]|nr:hemerythrin domain-containing protein [Pseudonocardiales bacterium]MBV9032807.1 hemerythrin domain-containing protein [Pseudonocardiales bacterium]